MAVSQYHSGMSGLCTMGKTQLPVAVDAIQGFQLMFIMHGQPLRLGQRNGRCRKLRRAEPAALRIMNATAARLQAT
ncbi:hypothetical protein D3C81_2024050 [compost metagenome]